MDSPPPSPHARSVVDQDDGPSSLSSRLMPWLRHFLGSSAAWKALPSHGGRLGVAVELRVDLTLSILDEDDEFEHLLQLREAIDLVRLALAVDPAALGFFLRGDVDRTSGSEADDTTASEKDAVEAVLTHGARSELHLVFEVNSIKTRLLEMQIADNFIHQLGQFLSQHAAFLALRAELIDQMTDRVSTATMTPVPVTVNVSPGLLEDISLLDADDFFLYLTTFSKMLVQIQRETGDMQWDISSFHAPLRVTGIVLFMQRFCITYRVVQAATTFIGAGIPVQCKQLNIDPRLISCSDQDVREFVTTLSKGADELAIQTGAEVSEELPGGIDDENQDRRDNIRVMMEAIAQAETIEELNLLGILELCSSIPNREEIIRGMFRQIFVRETPIQTLSLFPGAMLMQEDAAPIREETVRWRESNPGKTLYIKNLRLHFSNSDIDAIVALVEAVNDAEVVEVMLRHSMGTIPATTLYKVLSYPSLKSLSVRGVMVPTMDLFDPSVTTPELSKKPILQELVLQDFVLEDRTSMDRFLQELKGGAGTLSALSKSLRRLHFVDYENARGAVFSSDAGTLAALENVLATNRVLRDVLVCTNYDASTNELYKLLSDYDGTHIPANENLRRTAVAKARNLAFLSAIRSTGGAVDSAKSSFDAVIMSRILDFSASHALRHVRVSFYEEG